MYYSYFLMVLNIQYTRILQYMQVQIDIRKMKPFLFCKKQNLKLATYCIVVKYGVTIITHFKALNIIIFGVNFFV